MEGLNIVHQIALGILGCEAWQAKAKCVNAPEAFVDDEIELPF